MKSHKNGGKGTWFFLFSSLIIRYYLAKAEASLTELTALLKCFSSFFKLFNTKFYYQRNWSKSNNQYFNPFINTLDQDIMYESNQRTDYKQNMNTVNDKKHFSVQIRIPHQIFSRAATFSMLHKWPTVIEGNISK